jgi:general stress protein 26
MKIADQTRPDSVALADHIQGRRVAMLTMRDTHCQLQSQPMTPLEMDGNGAIWLMISCGGRTAQHVQANLPADTVNLAFSAEGKSTYVSITARASLSDDMQRKRELWGVMVRPWFPGGPEDADLTLLRLEPVHAEIWDAPDSTMVRLIALASSVIATKPVNLGGHEELRDLDPQDN